jgi:hypothetical protein
MFHTPKQPRPGSSLSFTLLFLISIASLASSASSPATAAAQGASELDLRSIPISEWLNAEEATEIPWRLRVLPVQLRMDQRLEVPFSATVRARDLNSTGNAHELFLISRVSSPDGEWLGQPGILSRSVDGELPKDVAVSLDSRAFVQPGEYLFWFVLYDRKTSKHNLAKQRVRVPEIRNDPLPEAFERLPLVEIPEVSQTDGGEMVRLIGELFLPITSKRRLDIELISTMSTPEQWTGRGRMERNHSEYASGAISALSQIEVENGSLSISGLDLVRREVIFDQRDFQRIDFPALMKAFKEAAAPSISAAALEGRRTNGAFFRDFLNQRLALKEEDSDAKDSPEMPLRVFIIITGSLLFERGSDLEPLQLEGDCNCRIYHLRFRLNVNDVFDQLQKLIRPLRPGTFDLRTPQDLRKAIAEILEELGKL